MAFEKVNYIAVQSDVLMEKEKRKGEYQKKLSEITNKLKEELSRNSGWIKLEFKHTIYYYQWENRGLFPDFSNIGYTKPLLKISEIPVSDRNDFLQLAGMKAGLMTKKELSVLFVSETNFQNLAEQWNWNKELFYQYFAVIPFESHSEVCRIDGKASSYWGTDTEERACMISMVHMADYSLGATYWEDILYLIKNGFILFFEDEKEQESGLFLSEYSQFIQKGEEGLRFVWEIFVQAEKNGELPQDIVPVIKPDKEQVEKIKDDLCNCDYERVSLLQYDKSILEPRNGHWDLWRYVKYNEFAVDKLPLPPEGKVWVDVSKEKIYARNAADDLASAAETVAIDFGTKSTTVAYVDDENHIVTVLVGEYASIGEIGESGYENPTILKFINFDDFEASYRSAEGRPETKFNDLSASYTAEKSFQERILSDKTDEVFAYHYQLKQWAFDQAFEPLIFDKHRRIRMKSYREIKEGDFDPIEVYAYLVGLNVVNMRLKRICTRYLLSYPSSFGEEICEKIRASFERGIKKAIPIEAQKTDKFKNQKNLVQLWQSEPAAYAACAIKEFGIVKKYKAEPVFCGVYDFGGGTVDYHFGVFLGGTPPYSYQSIQNSGDPRLGCENILEELAYKVFSDQKEILAAKKIKYEFPHQYAKMLQDIRYTSSSKQARLNTLGMINGLRDIWIHDFKASDNRLCYFMVYAEENKKSYYICMKDSKLKEENSSESFENETERKGEVQELTLYVDLQELKNFFKEKLEKTIREFLDIMKQTEEQAQALIQAEKQGKDFSKRKIIFLAGNGSKAPLVSEIFQGYIEGGKFDCELYPPLLTEKAKEKGQKVENRKGSIPTAKSGVAHGLLISRPGSEFIRIREVHQKFAFKYHLGYSRYDWEQEESIFELVRRAASFQCYERKGRNLAEADKVPFEVLENSYLQFWYTDSAAISEKTTIADCNARQFLIQVPEELCGNKGGECYCRAVSETELEILIKPIDQEEADFYGTLDLKNGRFTEYNEQE